MAVCGSGAALCCDVLQCVAVYCRLLFRATFSFLSCIYVRGAVCCRVLQCVTVCCSVFQCVAVCCVVLQCVTVCCSVLQCVAVCCSVLQCAAVRCSVLQCVATESLLLCKHVRLFVYTQRSFVLYNTLHQYMYVVQCVVHTFFDK